MPEEEKVAKPEPDPEEEKPQFDKRIPYTVIRSSRLSKPNDVRYIVVNLNDKDQVLDDASGYGYKSISAAQKGYGYKCRNLTKYGEVKHSSKPKTNIPGSHRAVSSRSGIFEKEGLYDLQRSVPFMGSGSVPKSWL